MSAGDPWDGRTLEWSISAPPPEYNFARLPEVTSRDAFAVAKAAGNAYQAPPEYKDIEVPRSTWLGSALGAASALAGFALVFHIWWLTCAAVIGGLLAFIVKSFETDPLRVVPASEVEREHKAWLEMVRKCPPVTRHYEVDPANRGVAALELTQREAREL